MEDFVSKLPFGISSDLELFQRQGLDRVICIMDDILVFATDANKHD